MTECNLLLIISKPGYIPLLIHMEELHPINMPVDVGAESVQVLAQKGEAHSKREQTENR